MNRCKINNISIQEEDLNKLLPGIGIDVHGMPKMTIPKEKKI